MGDHGRAHPMRGRISPRPLFVIAIRCTVESPPLVYPGLMRYRSIGVAVPVRSVDIVKALPGRRWTPGGIARVSSCFTYGQAYKMQALPDHLLFFIVLVSKDRTPAASNYDNTTVVNPYTIRAPC